MTETQNPPPGPPPGPRVGVDREHLRNYERLTRSTTDRKVAGVAGGLGRHLNVDPTVLRVLFVVLCFFGGAGFLLYGAAWLLVPEDGATEGKIATSPATRNGLLIAAGVVAVLILLGNSWNGVGFPWPVLIVGHRRAGLRAGARPAAVGPGGSAGRRTRPCRARPPREQAAGPARAGLGPAGRGPGRQRRRRAPAAVAGDPAAGAGVPAAVPQARTAAVRADARAGRGRPRGAGSLRRRRRHGGRHRLPRPGAGRRRRDARGRRLRRTRRRADPARSGRGLHPRGDLRGRRLPRPRLPRRPADLGRPRDRRPGALDATTSRSGRAVVDLSEVREPRGPRRPHDRGRRPGRRAGGRAARRRPQRRRPRTSTVPARSTCRTTARAASTPTSTASTAPAPRPSPSTPSCPPATSTSGAPDERRHPHLPPAQRRLPRGRPGLPGHRRRLGAAHQRGRRHRPGAVADPGGARRRRRRSAWSPSPPRAIEPARRHERTTSRPRADPEPDPSGTPTPIPTPTRPPSPPPALEGDDR